MRLLASLGGSHIYNYIQFEGEGGGREMFLKCFSLSGCLCCVRPKCNTQKRLLKEIKFRDWEPFKNSKWSWQYFTGYKCYCRLGCWSVSFYLVFFFFSLLMFKKEKSNQKHMNWKIPPFSLFNRPFFCFLNEMGEVIFNNNKINSKKKNWKENQTRLLSDIACLFETN